MFLPIWTLYKYLNSIVLLFLQIGADSLRTTPSMTSFYLLSYLLINEIVPCPANLKAGDTPHLSSILLLYYPAIKRVNLSDLKVLLFTGELTNHTLRIFSTQF